MSQTIAAGRPWAGADAPANGLPTAIPCYLPERNPHFRGRKEDISRLRESLGRSKTIGVTQQVAVFASGGVGKSSLALDFAWDCFASRPPKYLGGVFWCDCRSRDISSLADGLASLALPLGIASADTNDPLPVAQKVRERLTNGPPSLLILDNVIDAEQWKDKDWNALMPSGNCSRLLTTRAETVGDQRVPMLSLACLSEADARELLHSYRQDVGLEVKDDSVKRIIEWFGGLAIGLTVVGIYLGIHTSVTWDAYWKSLNTKGFDAVRDTEDLAAPADYANRVDAVIDDVFRSLTHAERRTLFYISILPGEDVSDRWLIELLTDDLNARKIAGSVPPGYSSLPHAIFARLIRRGILLRLIETTTRKTVFLHQVVRERLREILKLEHSLSRELSAHVRQLAIRLYHRSREWTRAIAESANLVEAQKLLTSMVAAEFDPDVYTFTALLSKAGTFDEAKAVFSQMKGAGHKPTFFTFNTLLTKAETYEDANVVVAQMKASGEKPDEYTFNTLLWKVEAFQDAENVIEQMEAANVEPNARTFNRLLSLARTFDESMAILDEMRRRDYKPQLYLVRNLMWSARTYEQAQAVAAEIEAAGGNLGELQFKALLSKARTDDQIDAVVSRGERAGLPLKLRALNRRLRTAESFKDAMAMFVCLLESGQKPIWHTFRGLFTHAKCKEEIVAIAHQMQAAGVQPKKANLMKMLLKTRTEGEAQSVVATLEAAGVRIWGNNLKSALPAAVSYPEAKRMIEQMLAKNEKPSVVQFTSLFSQREGLPHVEGVLGWYYALPYHPSDPLNALVASLRALGRVREAMSVVLQHPHLSAGQRLMREFPDEARTHFQSAKTKDSSHPTADLALGILAMETNRPNEAKTHFEEALQRARHPKMIETIQSKLKLMS